MNMKGKLAMMSYMFAALGSINETNYSTPFSKNEREIKELPNVTLKEPLKKIGNGKIRFVFNDEKFGEIIVMADNKKTAYKKYKLLLGINREQGF